MATIANQRWISIRNIIIYLETKFLPNRRIFVFGGHFVPWLPWQWSPFWICSTPQKLPHNTVDIPTKWNIIWLPNHGYQFPTSKSTWKSNFAQIGRFLYLAAILYLGYHGNCHHFEIFSTPQELLHTTVDIPTKFHEVWWKESNFFLNPPFFVSMATAAKFVQRFRFCWLISFH